MTLGRARAIFEQIESDKFTKEEKVEAIIKVMSMATTNSVRRWELMNALRWLCNEYITVEER